VSAADAETRTITLDISQEEIDARFKDRVFVRKGGV
jgi:hypothetical protein